MKTAIALFLTILLTAPGSATSIIFPTYSTPLLAEGRIVTISPGGSRMLAFSKEGAPVWQQSLPGPSHLFTHRSGTLMLATGSQVQTVNPEDGTLAKHLEVQPAVARLSYLEEGDLLWGCDDDRSRPTLAVFDSNDGRRILLEKQGERLVFADESLLVLLKCQRKATKGGYSFSNAWVVAFDRNTARRIWSVKFEKELDPWRSVVRIGGYFIAEDGPDLVVIDAKSGVSWCQEAEKPKGALGPNGLRNDKGDLVYVTSEMNSADYNKSKQTLYRLSVPDLKVTDKTVMEVIEANSVEHAGDFMITDALYRTACFRKDGSKVWEHFQMHRTPVHDGMIHFSDYQKGVARIGSIEVATGRERILASEKIKDQGAE